MQFDRVTGYLATNIFLSGAAFAATAPYRAVVGIDVLGMSNATFALVMALNALGGAITAVVLGWLSDKAKDRRVLVWLCALIGAIGFIIVWSLQTPIAFIIAFCLLVPFGNALFSQSFSYARVYFDRETPDRAELTISFLRTIFTIAWVVVPPLAGLIAAKTSAYSVFAFAAIAHIGCTVLVGLLFTEPRAHIGTDSLSATQAGAPKLSLSDIPLTYKIGIAGVILSQIALQLNMTVLPLFIIKDLGGSLAQVGINASVAAAIEVPVMIAWGYIALRLRKDTILAIACAVFAIYFTLMTIADNIIHVFLLQVIAAIAIAAILSINISYLQESIPGRVGLSTSLVDITRVVSALCAAGIFALNSGDTYAPLMAVAAVMSLCGAGFMLLASRV